MSLEKLFRDREIRKSILESVDINTPCHKGYCDDCGEYKTLYQIYDRYVCDDCISDYLVKANDYDVVYEPIDDKSIDESAMYYLFEQYVNISPDFEKLSDDADKYYNGDIPELIRSYGLNIGQNWNRSVSKGSITIDNEDMKSGKTRINQFFIDYDVLVPTKNTLDLLVPDADGTTAPKKLTKTNPKRKKDNANFAMHKSWYRDSSTPVQVRRGRPRSGSVNRNQLISSKATAQAKRASGSINKSANNIAPNPVSNTAVNTNITNVSYPSGTSSMAPKHVPDYDVDLAVEYPLLLPPYNTMMTSMGKSKLVFNYRDNDKLHLILSLGNDDTDIVLDEKVFEGLKADKKNSVIIFSEAISEYLKKEFSNIKNNKSKYPEYVFDYTYTDENGVSVELEINIKYDEKEFKKSGDISFIVTSNPAIRAKYHDKERRFSMTSKNKNIQDYFEYITYTYINDNFSEHKINKKLLAGRKVTNSMRNPKAKRVLEEKLANKLVKSYKNQVPELEDLSVSIVLYADIPGKDTIYSWIVDAELIVSDTEYILFDDAKTMEKSLNLPNKMKELELKNLKIKREDYPSISYKITNKDALWEKTDAYIYENYFNRVRQQIINEGHGDIE